MSRRLQERSWLALLILTSTAYGSVAAQETTTPAIYTGLCPIPSPLLSKPITPFDDLPPQAIGVRADGADIDSETQLASYFGNVEVHYGTQQLRTENAQINQESGNINASGATQFTDGYVQVQSENFRLNSGENRAYLSGARYQMSGTGARGRAEVLSISPAEVLLEGSTFTTCPEEEPAWQLSAEKIAISEDEAFGEAWNAKFELFGVPVLWVPYLNFPVTDERKSGFLFPTIRSSQQNGFEFEIPYYFNIAPNMDATLAPRYMAERGLQLQGEYRYLSEQGGGEFNLAYLNEDDSLPTDNSRFLWRVEHEQQWSEQWRSYVNAIGVSDDDYLNDIGSDFAGRADAQLYRQVQANYLTDDWQVTIRAEDFELLGNFRSPYRTLPQASSFYTYTDSLGLEYSLFSELSHFRNQDISSDYATRVHFEPQVKYAVERPAYDWLAEVGYSYTRYDQPANTLDGREENPDRGLPTVRWRGRLNLERDFDWNGTSYHQTLQPQVQYLYVPFRDQTGIGIYDSTIMQDDYRGLFRARRFTGLDRIADANQVTVGASSSLFDEQARELARISLAQIYYFEDSRTQLFDNSSAVMTNRSDIALETRFRLSDSWFFNSAVQYDMELNRTQKSQTALEYRKDEMNLVQLSHRNVTNILDDNIEQLGFQAVVELTSRWQMASNWYYDLQNKRSNDALLALQYSDCCWAIRFSAYRRINRNVEQQLIDPIANAPEFDNGISVQFIIKGLGSDDRSLLDMLEQSLFGYRHPFHLSN